MKAVLQHLRRTGIGALVGLLAAGTALGVGEFVAAFVRPSAAPVIAVGNKFVLLTPESLKEFAIRHFGSNDKNVLLSGIYVVIAVLAVVLGVLALRRLWIGLLGLVLFGAVGVWAAATANASRASDIVPTLIGTAAALVVLTALVRAFGGGQQWPLPRRWRSAETAPGDGARRSPDRRAFLLGSAGVAVLAAGSGVGGRALQHARFDAERSRRAVVLPRPASPAPPLPAGVDLGRGAVPFITPNNDFYRVDTALTVPQLPADTWQLRIHGQLDHPMTLSFDDLLSRPLIERWITMTCVSDAVGGPYVSTAKFLGVPLAPLLKEAGVHADADQLVGTSSDGMTIGTPIPVIMDGRDAMLAVGMNGEPLPLAHGFPCRMLVPGLYGYVSATKWLVDLEATTFAKTSTYWVDRKWAPKAPIRMESRIDTPKGLTQLTKGQKIMIAGVAWHQTIGIKSVQVRIDEGPWMDADLGRVPSVDTWVQWSVPWTVAGDGPVTLQVRAIDNHGEVQDSARRGVFPSGATGWHSIVVTVS
ncbi:MAG: molybdopterin-dependent oxidoreductase [Jatrophihabitans sp.]|uniref:molybdopterin-dependent oxidoreductase n=1 Tax=Jatrophihabitans sp. TaxID=1932789 RepID=UPI003F7D7929